LHIYFNGHVDFRNRGSEALIRASVTLLRKRWPEAKFLCPSSHPEYDAQQWPEAVDHGVEFVQAPRFPSSLAWWGRLERRLPIVNRLGFPSFRIPGEAADALRRADIVLVTGGDVLSIEYGNNSLAFWVGISEMAISMGKPVHIWASSLGPYSATPAVERAMFAHLQRCKTISVRETISERYLETLGLQVSLAVDPAFALLPEEWHGEPSLMIGNTLLGLNLSSHARRLGARKGNPDLYDDEIKRFMRHILAETDMSLILIPHVDPFGGTYEDSDSAYLTSLMNGVENRGSRISIVPPTLNAAQLKYVIGLCDYFIGARTHSTIASLSQCVPTVSISYSVKALGINRDLFGHTNYVLPTAELSFESLVEKLDIIVRQSESIVETLKERIKLWKTRAEDLPHVLDNA